MHYAIITLAVAAHGIWMKFSFPSVSKDTPSFWRTVDQDGNMLDILVAESAQQTHGETIVRKLLQELQNAAFPLLKPLLRTPLLNMLNSNDTIGGLGNTTHSFLGPISDV